MQFSLEGASNLVLAIVAYAGMVLAAFWLAMVIWAYRDMRARSRDVLAQFVVAGMVALLNLPGLLIYIFLRPRETLSEAYERSLEEEALLQEIEEKPNCPGCRQRVREEWQACPSCHTRLKKPCVRCGKMLDLSWSLCPYCATPQANTAAVAERPSAHVRPTVPTSPQWAGGQKFDSAVSFPRTAESLEFIEGDEG